MQHPQIRKWIFRGLVCVMLAFGTVQAQSPWMNDQPWWEIEDETPVLSPKIRLKLFNLSQAYHLAGEYHNDHFVREYTRREPQNAAFNWRWRTFEARWVGFNDYLARFQRSVWVVAGSVSANEKVRNIDHIQLAGATRAVLKGLVKTARDLTFYLEGDIVIKKWEIFIVRLEHLEDTLKDFD